MSRIVKVSQSDYRLQVQPEGTITLDVGVSPGKVVITGDLLVEGNTTTVNTTNLEIEDNIIRLNVGETGVGITEGTSGIEIARGSLPNALFVFDESITWFDPLTNSIANGGWTVTDTNGKTGAIRIASIGNDGTTDIVFDLQNSGNFLSLVNTDATAYANAIMTDIATTTFDNTIPNIKTIKSYVSSGAFTPGMADVDKIYKTLLGVERSRVQAYTASIDFLVNQTLNAQITVNGLNVNNINLFTNTVSNISNNNLVLTSALQNVELNATLWLDDQTNTPTAESGTTKIYSSATSGPGKTGLFFANLTTSDELVAKNRALLFSMIF